MEEVWKEIEGYSQYEVSSSGKVRDKDTQEERPLVWNGNFLCTNLTDDSGKRSLCKIHRLVASAFLPNPQNAHNVVHKSGDRSDNNVDNLYWKPKAIKEKKERPIQKYEWSGNSYSAEELSINLNLDITLLQSKLKLGWKVHEILAGSKDFVGHGYQTETHWYPTKAGYEKSISEQKQRLAENERRLKLQKAATERAEKKSKIHNGFGIFVNYPIRGINGGKATRAYYVWQGIIARCYNPNHDSYGNYGGRGCVVSEKWKHFQDFAMWYQEQQKRGMGNAHVNWHVDKDILIPGNLEYGPDTCCFVPGDVNIFFASIYSKGYSYYRGKWKAEISILGVKQSRLFDSEEDAKSWYSSGKTKAAELLLWKYQGLLDDKVTEKLSNI